LAALARNAAANAIEEFRNKPNRIGRARMFAEKSVGMDDPGMVAVLRMTESL
jgi:dihydroxyacetone kinase-like protein